MDDKSLLKGLENLKKHYNKSEIIKSYENLRFSDLSGKIEHKITISFLNNLITKYKSNNLLEIGIGPGRITKDLVVFNKAFGVDYSNNMLELTKKNVKNKKWRFFRASITKMPFNSKIFDMAISFRLIAHFNKKERELAYKEIKRVLMKKSLFVFDLGNVKYKKPLMVRILLGMYRIFFKEKVNKLLPEIYNIKISLNELKEELNKFNFNIDKIYGINYYNSLVLLLLSISKRLKNKSLLKLIEKIILNIEKNNQKNLNNYAEYIVVTRIN